MSVHAYHGPEQEHLILKDNCERCSEHAQAPWRDLDNERRLQMIAMALRVEWSEARCNVAGVPPSRAPGSQAEFIACKNINDTIGRACALFDIQDWPRWAVERTWG